MTHILILNGPNLNLLGTRQPETYGTVTLKDIEGMCAAEAGKLGATYEFEQSNHEGTLIDLIHATKAQGIILNAGAYTHTSIAIMDAITSANKPVLELHLSNIHQRERFRHHSYISKVAFAMICGLGASGYPLAMRAMHEHLAL
ncbi:MAG: type II 3-dehydroquinate dehydratase [Rhodobacteraceae bacterium]|nr:type II 3-dehydroquinate dehydratase [Paracoccaceae bacterium]